MKSRTSSNSNRAWRLYSSMSALRESGRREQREQPVDAGLDQVDAGRFQRLEETRRQTDRDDVLLPGLRAAVPARSEPGAGRPAASPSRLASKVCGSFVVADQVGRIDVAVADPVLQRDAPLPAGRARRAARIRRDGRHALARDGKRAIAEQPLVPMFIADAQCVADQQCRACPSSRRTGRRRPRARRSAAPAVDEARLSGF